MSDVPDLSPVTDDDYALVLDYLTDHWPQWEAQIRSGLADLTAHLAAAGYQPTDATQRPDLATGRGDIEPRTVLVSARLKEPEAVVAKMSRFGEPLRVMLDVWGYRLVVATEEALDAVANHGLGLWATPAPAELLLRHGALQFQPWRDYRRRDHAVLAAGPGTRLGDLGARMQQHRRPAAQQGAAGRVLVDRGARSVRRDFARTHRKAAADRLRQRGPVLSSTSEHLETPPDSTTTKSHTGL